MTLYTATCAIDEDDTVTAMRSENRVELESSSRASVFLDPGPARTFARGILALADEIDGGEAEASASLPKIGTRFRVTRNGVRSAGVSVGDVVEVSQHHAGYFSAKISGSSWYFEPEDIGNGLEPVDEPTARPIQVGDTVRVVTDDSHLRTGEFIGRTGKVVQVGNRFSSRLKYRLEFPGEKFWWVEKVELVDEAPGLDRPIKVGARVEIVRAERSSRHEEGRVGIVGTVDEDDDRLPYRVVDEHGVYIAWCAEVRRLDDLAEDAGPEPTRSPFARFVDEAKGLLEGTDHTATDVIVLARELRDAE
jgi:hypothetical protein